MNYGSLIVLSFFFIPLLFLLFFKFGPKVYRAALRIFFEEKNRYIDKK